MAYLGWKAVVRRGQPRDTTVLLSVLYAVSCRFLPCSWHGSSHAVCAVWTGRTSCFFPAPHHLSLALELLWPEGHMIASPLLIVTWQHCPAGPSICWTAETRSSHMWYSTRGTYSLCLCVCTYLFKLVWQCPFAILKSLYSAGIGWVCQAWAGLMFMDTF